MFDKIKFAKIIKEISNTYDNQRDFSKKSEINRTYLSQYMNMKLDEPPKPKLLKKLANASNGLTNYNELMNICGYSDNSLIEEYLEDMYYEESKRIENELISIHLSKKEQEAYESISNIINNRNFLDIEQTEFDNKLSSYLEPLEWLNRLSKNKIKKKLTLLMQYLKLPKTYVEQKSRINNSNNDIQNKTEKSHYYMCPVYGQISAGQPNWAEECIEGRIPIDPNLMNIINPEEHFFLRVNGESMNKVIKNGAFALIHKQDIVKNGEIAVVLVNGYDATLKKFTKQDNLIILEPQSTDESFETQVYDKNTTIKILGKYVGKMELN